jgi:hypothetical protein
MAAHDRNAAHERRQVQEISVNVARRLLSVLERGRFAPPALAAEIDSKAHVISAIQHEIDQLMASQPAHLTLDVAVLTHVLGSQQHALALVEYLEAKIADISAATRPPTDQARAHAALLATAREIEQDALRYAALPTPSAGYPRAGPGAPALGPPPNSSAPYSGAPAQRRLPPPSPPPPPPPPGGPQPPRQAGPPPRTKQRPPSGPSPIRPAPDRLAAVRALAAKPGPAAIVAVLAVTGLVGAVWWLLPQADARFVSQASTAIEQGPKLDGRLDAAGADTEQAPSDQAAATGPPMTFNTANAAGAREMEQPYLVVLATRKSTDELQKEFLNYRAAYPALLGSSKARVDRVQGQDRQTWYRLSVIPPQARDDAKALCSNLRSAGLTGCWIKPVPLN